MLINSLSLNNFRVFEEAEFKFTSGMNLIVGVNGAGKSSVLDALRILSKQILSKVDHINVTSQSFDNNDINAGKDIATVSANFTLESGEYVFSGIKSRNKYLDNENAKGIARGQSHSIRDRSTFLREGKPVNYPRVRPEECLVVYFSTRRSITTTSTSKNKVDSVFNESLLAHRFLNIKDIANWWWALQELANERTFFQEDDMNQLEALKRTILNFLPMYSNVEAIGTTENRTIILERTGATLDISQLSDGERSIIALVLDLTRRLSLVYGGGFLEATNAIVLIDELDLHLHPVWQREVVHKLTQTFPNCQFIATTHSPQIIGEVKAEKITVLENGLVLTPPHQSKGMDSNWILRHIMGADERNSDVKDELERISALITDKNYTEAMQAIRNIRSKYGVFPEIVQLQTIIDRIQLLGR